MNRATKKKIRKLNVKLHRDLGYFFSALIIAYSLSGLALNHLEDWNPDFIITKETIAIPKKFSSKKQVGDAEITELGEMVGEKKFKIYDFPTPSQVKIYYDNASFHVNFKTKEGIYEKVSKRPVFYQTNVLHRNSFKPWRWILDIFALMLITITLTGIFIMRGKHGITGRGKWLISAGIIPPLLALLLFEIL